MIVFESSQDTLRLSGDLTIYEAREARLRLAEAFAAGPGPRLDLSGLEALDTAGAQVLLWLWREVKARGSAPVLVHPSPAVLEVLGQLNLVGAFEGTLLIAPNA